MAEYEKIRLQSRPSERGGVSSVMHWKEMTLPPNGYAGIKMPGFKTMVLEKVCGIKEK
jgi:hypothetical protein